ncbi:MAG: sigma-E factor negative regulatory protein [Gammaproteobacteria bacterium]|jgi:negative regulator of sigma E activity|nr:sigma-E factor negative regulatory protein [Gammaproteobacteria bacterium]
MSTNKRREKISALLDDEIHRDEIMSFSLSSEPEDAEVARRYQMIGDTMRGEMSEACFVDVSKAVHEALLKESLAARPHGTPASRKNNSNTGKFSLYGWLQPVAGMAMAASVAVVMVVTFSGQDSTSPLPVANNIDQLPAAAPMLRLAEERKAIDENTRNLDPRLVNQHLEFATQDALQGRLPYVRAVSYQKNR